MQLPANPKPHPHPTKYWSLGHRDEVHDPRQLGLSLADPARLHSIIMIPVVDVIGDRSAASKCPSHRTVYPLQSVAAQLLTER